MFLDHQIGAGSPANTPSPIVTLNGTRLEVFYIRVLDKKQARRDLVGVASEFPITSSIYEI